MILSINEKTQLQKRAAKGDQEAYAVLYETFRDNLVSILSNHGKHGNHVHDAEDAVQEAIIAIINSNAYDPSFAFSTYFFSCAKRKQIDYLRKISRRHTISYDAPDLDDWVRDNIPSNEIPPGKSIPGTRDEKIKILHEAMLSLSPTMFEVFELMALRQLKQREVATLLNIPIGTVKSRYSSAISKIHRIIGKIL